MVENNVKKFKCNSFFRLWFLNKKQAFKKIINHGFVGFQFKNEKIPIFRKLLVRLVVELSFSFIFDFMIRCGVKKFEFRANQWSNGNRSLEYPPIWVNFNDESNFPWGCAHFPKYLSSPIISKLLFSTNDAAINTVAVNVDSSTLTNTLLPLLSMVSSLISI